MEVISGASGEIVFLSREDSVCVLIWVYIRQRVDPTGSVDCAHALVI